MSGERSRVTSMVMPYEPRSPRESADVVAVVTSERRANTTELLEVAGAPAAGFPSEAIQRTATGILHAMTDLLVP
jgi:hypothetical protein